MCHIQRERADPTPSLSHLDCVAEEGEGVGEAKGKASNQTGLEPQKVRFNYELGALCW